jgi:predicted 3-demethylubiquinone-9 3-methyltransferase (glyoxalase superfamily)
MLRRRGATRPPAAAREAPVRKVTPFLWFDDDLEDALRLYAAVLPDVRILEESRVAGPGSTLFSARFSVGGQEFLAINGGPTHRLTEAFSIMVLCDDQAEVDRYWDHLTDGGEEQPCGWLKDRFGVSWQIVPRRLMELLGDPDPGRAARARDAMLGMHRISIADLEAAAGGALAT